MQFSLIYFPVVIKLDQSGRGRLFLTSPIIGNTNTGAKINVSSHGIWHLVCQY